MAKLIKIVKVLPPDYDSQEALAENGDWLTLVTNIDKNELEKYIQLIRSFNSHAVFGISEEAWGFYEDEGKAFSVDGHGLFIRNRRQLAAFWEHADKMKCVHRSRPGYRPGYVGYRMNVIKKPKTNAQRKQAKRRLYVQR